MNNPLPCLRRIEPSAALIPHPGQRTLAYVPAQQSDIRKRIHDFNRSIAIHVRSDKLTEGVSDEAPATRWVLRSDSIRNPAKDRAWVSQVNGPDEGVPPHERKRWYGGMARQGCTQASLSLPIRLKDLARAAMAYARRRDDATAVHRSAEVVRGKTLPHRMLLQDERAEIDALTRLIGPAFRAALTRAASRKEGWKP